MQVKVWDLPLRAFHWLLVLAVGAAWLTAEMAEDLGDSIMEVHECVGLLILGLLVFRVVWGFVGSTHARFTNFFPTPARLKAYRAGEWKGHGHNPLGALSVFGLLGLLLIQASTGLFANDDVSFTGPLYSLVTAAVSDRLTGLHHLAFDGLTILIALHVAAIAFYLRVKKVNLVRPMITGQADTDAVEAEKPATGGGLLAFLLALTIAVGVVFCASGVLLPAPTATASTNNW